MFCLKILRQQLKSSPHFYTLVPRKIYIIHKYHRKKYYLSILKNCIQNKWGENTTINFSHKIITVVSIRKFSGMIITYDFPKEIFKIQYYLNFYFMASTCLSLHTLRVSKLRLGYTYLLCMHA